MNSIKFVHYIFFFLLLISCKSKNNSSDYQIEIIAEQKITNSLQHFIKSIQYIPLETKEESLLGYVTKLVMHENRIYILDQLVTKSLFVFNNEGKFIYKIARKGNGPGEYGIITDFYINQKNKTIHLFANGRKVINFDFEGNFIDEQKLPLLHSSFMIPTTENKFYLINQPDANADYLLYSIDSTFNILNEYIKTPKKWERIARASNIYYSGYTGMNYLYSYVCSTIIYELTNNNVLPKYNFILPSDVKLTEKSINAFNNLDERELVMKTLDYFSLDSYFEMNSKLFLEFSMKNITYWGIFDIVDNTFEYNERDYRKIENDFVYPIFLSQINENSLAGVIMPGVLPDNNNFGLTENSNPLIGVYEFKFID